eukprot:scaffold1991_cov158-Amphora_coffeaeformis.AAC.5
MVNSLHEDALEIQMMSDDPTFLCKTVGDPSSMNLNVLNFVFLGCEPKMPYGPVEHTAQLMMDLLAQALTEATAGAGISSAIPREEGDGAGSSSNNDTCWMLRMKIYDVQKQDYPKSIQEWDSYHGIILPGSFSAAYDDEPWIRTLCEVIQTEIVPKRRKTLGICFGHQVLAHSFDDGLASKMPLGSRAGRFTLQTTNAGQSLLLKNKAAAAIDPQSALDYFYTHGDQVERLPAQAVCLGGDERVPILSAAYFDTPEDAAAAAIGTTTDEVAKPYAITFQAHPEYASSTDLGLYRTLNLIMDLMVEKNLISVESRDAQGDDSIRFFEKVRKDSLHTMVTCGRLLGWFPSENGKSS